MFLFNACHFSFYWSNIRPKYVFRPQDVLPCHRAVWDHIILYMFNAILSRRPTYDFCSSLSFLAFEYSLTLFNACHFSFYWSNIRPKYVFRPQDVLPCHRAVWYHIIFYIFNAILSRRPTYDFCSSLAFLAFEYSLTVYLLILFLLWLQGLCHSLSMSRLASFFRA